MRVRALLAVYETGRSVYWRVSIAAADKHLHFDLSLDSSVHQQSLVTREVSSSTQVLSKNMSSICSKCDKPVYAAEELLAGGLKWHKVCFKCNLCNKRLDSTNVNAHEKALWCKQCYSRKFVSRFSVFRPLLIIPWSVPKVSVNCKNFFLKNYFLTGPKGIRFWWWRWRLVNGHWWALGQPRYRYDQQTIRRECLKEGTEEKRQKSEEECTNSVFDDNIWRDLSVSVACLLISKYFTPLLASSTDLTLVPHIHSCQI